ncbi:carbohydrate kinase family protein [Micromonospora sp. KC207]|uniref:carbohydrate kinase family protein n=1 Tax=Micromonospora sp. KC207 TaxID=2530377 RepID=UPI0014044C80|nr:carbohydrate kinase family protein [Micromonospora sp. KC207]
MSSPSLDLVCVSYLADAGIQHVTDYPAANHGAIITETFDSIAADGPITALTARLLGLRVGLISNQIGADPEGQRLLATLDRAHIQHTIDPDVSGTTPKLTVITDDAGTRTWFAWLDHAYAQLAVANLAMIATARLAYIDCYSAITEAAARAIRFADRTPLILNLGSDQLHPDIQQATQGRQILAVQTSIDETDAGDAEALAADILGRLRPQAVVITLGRYGAIALTRDGLHHAQAPQAPVRHTHGAGAAFSAGYAHALLLGGTVDEALAAGCGLGTDHCAGRNPIIPAQRQLQPALRL